MRVETVTSLVTNIYNLGSEGLQTGLLFQIGGYVDVNRNEIVKSAIEQNMTHLLFLDNDMIFPENAIKTLLDHNKDIIGANYNVRLDPTSKALSNSTVKMKINGEPVSMLDLPKGLFECYAVATGFMLIKLSIFKKLKEPYFEATIKDGVHHTEDVDFCRKANEAGIKVFCDPSLKLGHIGQAIY